MFKYFLNRSCVLVLKAVASNLRLKQLAGTVSRIARADMVIRAVEGNPAIATTPVKPRHTEKLEGYDEEEYT